MTITTGNRVELSDRAREFLNKLDKGQPGDLKKIHRALDKLRTNTRPPGCTYMFQFRGQRIWALKAGWDYRICYRVTGDAVYVVAVGKRESIYDEVKHLTDNTRKGTP